MNYTLLEKMICDTVKEEQIKLGYERETVRLYYPMSTLANILEEEIHDTEKMDEILEGFIRTSSERLGKLKISHTGNRYCILVPPEGSAYIHEVYDENPFLEEFINAVRRHDGTLESILAVFRSYSNQVICEKSGLEDFDYVIYFGDEKQEDYRYCIKFEGGHTIYHRFLKKDYEML